MQKVTVKDVKTNRGKRKDGSEWVKTTVIGEDGASFGSFRNSAQEISAGDVIELEPKVTAKGVDFEQFNVLQKSTAPAPTPQPTGNGKDPGGYKKDIEGMRFEYQLKAQMQEIDRKSFHGQVALKEAGEWIRSVNANPEASFKPEDQTVKLYEDTIKKLIPLLTTQPPKKAEDVAQRPAEQPSEKPAVSNGKGQQVDPEHPFPHIGALLKWCDSKGIGRAKFMEILQVKEKDLANVNISEAHQAIKDHLKEHNPNQPDDTDPEEWKKLWD